MSDRAKDEKVHGLETIGAGFTSQVISDYHSDAAAPARRATRVASQFFGSALEPVLLGECGGRLSRISWFRADWQRGGALTGYATYKDDHGRRHEAVVKMPVPPGERRWLVDLQHASHVVPRLYAHGEQLNGYDIAWVVMERLPHGPLGPQWSGSEFDLVIEAAGRFYAAAANVPVRGNPLERDWEHLFAKARDHVHSHSVPDEQRWKEALKKAHRKLHDWIVIWHDRPTGDWCHGDLHLGNALTHHPPAPQNGSDTPHGPAVLIDFANTHRGCWVEDGVYFEHLFWSHRRRLGGRKLCKALAKARRDHGVPVDPNWSDFAAALRALYAMSTPARLYDDGDPLHLSAALEVLEAAVK